MLTVVTISQWWDNFPSAGENLYMKPEIFPQNGMKGEIILSNGLKEWLLLIDDISPNVTLPLRTSHFKTCYQLFTVQRNAQSNTVR